MGWITSFLLGLLVVLTILHQSDGQEAETTDVETQASKLENSVVSDMLRIVDNKFDTINTRMIALERALSTLQYYSIRQFRQLSGNIQKTQNDFATVNKKVGQLGVDGRALKISMSLLGGNVADLKTTTSGILGELESSVVYINDNVDKHAKALQQQIKESANRSEQAIERHLNKIAEAAAVKKTEEDKVVNCSVDFSELAGRIDTRFADFKQQTYAHCAKLIDNARSQALELNRVRAQGEERSRVARNEESVDATPSQAAFSSSPEGRYGARHSKELLQRKKLASKEGVASKRPGENDVGYGEEYDDRVMNLLFNMTTSVLQATNYFRHSSSVMEEILSNTGVLVTDNAYVKRELGLIKVSLLNQSAINGLDKLRIASRPNMPVPDMRGISRQPGETANFYNPSWTAGRGLKDCKLSATALGGLETIVKNGSQLLEVLTDLAQMSSMSLTKATTSLQDEVKRVENFHTSLTSTVLSKVKEFSSEPLTNVKNTTQRIVQLVESIASETRWIPVIQRDVQKVGKMLNRSIHLSSSSNGLLQRIHQLQTSDRRPLDNRIARVPPRAENELPDNEAHPESTATSSLARSQQDVVLDKESLEMISKTNRQLRRIMPALTKLLAEPDPLITLVEGKHTDQGRIEIYNHGQWGTICHADLNNVEADAVCRHLGFPGGISAGAGHFGPGSGIAWTLNISCLAPAATCPIVTQLVDVSQCNHERDAAVICDHMLRISSGNETRNNKIGRLEMHHKGLWLPICSEGWSGYSARVACQQMGFKDGREVVQGEWQQGANSTWFSNVACRGHESRLDACANGGWTKGCARNVPAGVRCL